LLKVSMSDDSWICSVQEFEIVSRRFLLFSFYAVTGKLIRNN